MAPTSPHSPEALLALAEQHLVVVLQPIVDVQTGVPHAYEALLRGHAALGFADPPDLLDAFADRGLIVALETLLHRRAVEAFAAACAALPGGTARLFLNIDTRVLADEPGAVALMQRTVDLMARHGLAAGRLCWELSERHRIITDAATTGLLEEMRERGVRFAADDFGQGHSELKLMFDQRVDYIKLDKFFIQDLAVSGRRRLFVSKLAGFAHVLGLKVVAEGVETEEDLLACRELGCDYAQGWCISRPLPAGGAFVPFYPDVAALGARLRRRRVGDGAVASLADRIIRTKPTRADSAVEQVFDLFRENAALTLCPVLDAMGTPVGVVPEQALRPVVYHAFGRDLLRNAASRRATRDFMQPCPVVDMETALDTALEAFAAQDDAHCLLVTESGRYAGVLLPAVLLAVSVERRLADASAQNPLTALPGNLQVQAALGEAAQARGLWRHVCYFDFDNFKPFNDVNGFRVGDRAITLFAETLRRALPEGERNFIGHVGGDDFVAVLHGVAPSTMRAGIAQLLGDFAAGAARLHTLRDRQAQCYETRDRYGELRRFPLLRASCAVIALGPTVEIDGSGQLTLDPMIARLKSMAKANPDGLAWFAATSGRELEDFARQLDVLEA